LTGFSATGQEFEQALRLLHREAWQSRSINRGILYELKRRFEDGLSNVEMAQYLRLHVRDCDFAATVLKARQYADAAESTRPKKSVRIPKKNPIQTVEVAEDATYFQPLIDGIRYVMGVLSPRPPRMIHVDSYLVARQTHTPPGSRAQSPAPQEQRSYAGCLTAQGPGNRQSRPIDRGSPWFQRFHG